MISRILSAISEGIDGCIISVETDIYKKGLPRFTIIGLPDNGVKESKDRVKTAIVNSKFDFPKGVITVNLAPAGLRKSGAVLDLAIALSILKASGQINEFQDKSSLFMGELSLDGSIRQADGVLPVLLKARELGLNRVFMPFQNSGEAAMITGPEIIPIKSLEETTAILNKTMEPAHLEVKDYYFIQRYRNEEKVRFPDFSDIAGQNEAKRAIEIAVAGRHNLLMIGPPGSGKTMLASRVPGIMPDMTFEEALETTRIYSSRGMLNEKNPFILERPYRNPHHSASGVALVGGGSIIRCGEISLAHNGVLFLDEFPEFNSDVIQALREPLESRTITISRSSGSVTLPADILFLAAMNPCPCGFMGDDIRTCICLPAGIHKYYQKISGPILDRIDIHIHVPRPDLRYLQKSEKNPLWNSKNMKQRIDSAVQKQKDRGSGQRMKFNSRLSNEEVNEFCALQADASEFLNRSIEKLGLSLRAYFKVLKIARTIADLEAEQNISIYHLSEAIQYRILDRHDKLF